MATALVTGATAGIGAEFARQLAARGDDLVLVARDGDRLTAYAEELSTRHRVKVDVLVADLTDRAQLRTVEERLADVAHPVDLLVNNAGLSRGLEKLPDADPADYEEMIDTNVKGLLWVSQAILPGMVARDRGHVVNIGSIAGHQVYAGGSVYCATKHAVGAITQGLRLDLLGTRVRVSTVDPGMVETEFSLVRFHGDAPRADQVYTQFPPLGPADVAEAVLWCVTRPWHVNVAEIILMPTDQAAVYGSHPRGR